MPVLRHRPRPEKRPVVWVGGPVPPGSSAITLGRLIIVRREAADNDRLLRHELVHVEQWRRYGVVGFLRRYLGAYLRLRFRGHGHKDAYRRIPLEEEAERLSRDPDEGAAPRPGEEGLSSEGGPP